MQENENKISFLEQLVTNNSRTHPQGELFAARVSFSFRLSFIHSLKGRDLKRIVPQVLVTLEVATQVESNVQNLLYGHQKAVYLVHGLV